MEDNSLSGFSPSNNPLDYFDNYFERVENPVKYIIRFHSNRVFIKTSIDSEVIWHVNQSAIYDKYVEDMCISYIDIDTNTVLYLRTDYMNNNDIYAEIVEKNKQDKSINIITYRFIGLEGVTDFYDITIY